MYTYACIDNVWVIIGPHAQGCAVFVFHVVRHEKNWTKIKKFVASRYYIIMKSKETNRKCQLSDEVSMEM